MSKTITVDIDDQGNSTIDLQGFHGQGCAKVMQDLQGADEATVVERKREYHEQCEAEERVRG